MHNTDVIHQEYNVAESIVMTCMNFLDKTKDNKKMKKDFAMIFHWPSLELSERGHKPHALFCLKVKERKEVKMWMNNFKFLDGFAACVLVAALLSFELGVCHPYGLV
jgi:hypothetical protein